MRILLDMDETICDFLTPLLKKYNEKYDTNLQHKDITEYNLDKYEGMTDIFYEYGFFIELLPYPNSKMIIKRLINEGHKIFIVTNAMSNWKIINGKLNWIARYLKFVNKDNIIFTSNKSIIMGDVLFDDAPHYINSFTGIRVINDRPYNQNANEHFRIYDNNWEQFYQTIKFIEKSMKGVIEC